MCGTPDRHGLSCAHGPKATRLRGQSRLKWSGGIEVGLKPRERGQTVFNNRAGPAGGQVKVPRAGSARLCCVC